MSLRQRLVPSDVLGRVNAASRTLSMTAAPLGALAGGWIAHALGPRAPLWVSGIALAVLAPFAVRLWRPRARGGAADLSRPAEE